ncbi:cytochrome c oxidase subunit II [Paenibacillus xanthanilyticus]|uniref:Cytochrome aa3 subunit 2 n=1 Tax=Paenibacillus xanthanilyticus TaxID=1783531 RepID=A0ABV8K8D4_9BACL
MHIHRLEKIWLTVGIAMLFVFLGVIGVSAFAMGTQPPSRHHHMIDPAKVNETAPFNQPGVFQVGKTEYEAVIVSYAFGYTGGPEEQPEMRVPAGSTVHFTATSTDVVHGFEIPGTNVNMMLVPGEVSQVSHTFDRKGEYLILCNEYCGTGHEYMMTKLIVE